MLFGHGEFRGRNCERLGWSFRAFACKNCRRDTACFFAAAASIKLAMHFSPKHSVAHKAVRLQR